MQGRADGVGCNPLDPDCFYGRFVTRSHGHIAFAYSQQLRQEGDKCLVGLALLRWGGQRDPGPPIQLTQKTGARGTGYDLDGKQNSVFLSGQVEHVDIVHDVG